MRILIVENQVGELRAELFAAQGHDCKIISDAKKGLNLILSSKFDRIFLDLDMPMFNNFDIIDEIAKKKKVSELNIAVLTSRILDDIEKQELRRKGVQSILRKPILPDDWFRDSKPY